MSVINVRFMEHRGAGGGEIEKNEKNVKNVKNVKMKKMKKKI